MGCETPSSRPRLSATSPLWPLLKTLPLSKPVKSSSVLAVSGLATGVLSKRLCSSTISEIGLTYRSSKLWPWRSVATTLTSGLLSGKRTSTEVAVSRRLAASSLSGIFWKALSSGVISKIISPSVSAVLAASATTWTTTSPSKIGSPKAISLKLPNSSFAKNWPSFLFK